MLTDTQIKDLDKGVRLPLGRLGNYRPNTAALIPYQNGFAGMERMRSSTQMQAIISRCIGSKPSQKLILPSSTASRSRVKPFW